jgi:hypothetical protein
MADIETAYNQELDADLAREQPADHILSQLALVTIMLSLEVDLLAFVRVLNAADADAAPLEQASHPAFARLVRRLPTANVRLPWQSSPHELHHSPA